MTGARPRGIVRAPARRARVLLLALLAGCGAQNEEYFPLAPGMRWDYAVTRATMDGVRHQRHRVVNLRAVRLDRLLAVPRLSGAGHIRYYARGAGGVVHLATRLRGDVDPTRHHPPRTVLPPVPVPGTRWHAPTRTVALERTGPPQRTLYRLQIEVPMDYVVAEDGAIVHVPAGRFERCLRVDGRGSARTDARNYVGLTEVEVVTRDWYAPGVGLVRAERHERTASAALSAGSLLLELLAFEDP